MNRQIAFRRLATVAPDDLIAHMSDPRVGEHMPLLNFDWDRSVAEKFVADKEAAWRRDGLGHWAIFVDGVYVGWGGFQKEGEEWDFGLVLKPNAYGLGAPIVRKAIAFAIADKRIPYVTFLLAPTRRSFGALRRLGAREIGSAEVNGARFLKFRLDTP